MGEESSTFRWAVGALIGLLAAGGGIAAIYGIFFNPPKSDKPTQPDPTYTNQPAPENPKSNPVSPIVEKVDCNIGGTVYDGSKNPMPNVEILLIDEKNKETSLTRTGDGGKFEANCSQISQEHFPQKLQVKGDVWHWDYTAKIPRGGQKSINVYVPEYILLEAAKTRARTTAVKSN